MPQQLVITLEDNGQLNVNGPIHNKVFCFGVLELAKEAISEYNRAAANKIVAPSVDDQRVLAQN